MNQAYGGSGIGGPITNYNNIQQRPSYYPNMNSDFASLPPAVNMMPTKDLRIDSQDILDGLEQRR